MFLVGGTILTHGIPVVGHAIEALAAGRGALGSVLTLALEGGVGVLTGGMLVALVSIVQRARGRGTAA
jgi:predicted DNA repair protein MutK